METVKTDNDRMMDTSPREAGFFYRRIGGTLFRVRDKGEVKKLKSDLAKKGKCFADLDLLIKKVYEDNAMGKLPDRRYEMLSSDYEREQQELEENPVTAEPEKERIGISG